MQQANKTTCIWNLTICACNFKLSLKWEYILMKLIIQVNVDCKL